MVLLLLQKEKGAICNRIMFVILFFCSLYCRRKKAHLFVQNDSFEAIGWDFGLEPNGMECFAFVAVARTRLARFYFLGRFHLFWAMNIFLVHLSKVSTVTDNYRLK